MILQKDIKKLVAKANFKLRNDVKSLLEKAYQKESNARAKKALGWILENARVAEKEKIALCQDTGLPVVFVEVGEDVEVSVKELDQIKQYLAQSYKESCLRASIVSPFKRINPSYQGGIVHVEFSKKKKGITISFLPKGFGSENKSQLKMFNPTASVLEIEDFIVASVKQAGAAACPPFVVGVGIGGTSDYALLLAKKALLEKIDKNSLDKNIAELEKRLLKRINALSIGPMGLGGKCTALAVKIKTYATHIAGLPVGVNISCHALRSAAIKIKNKNEN